MKELSLTNTPVDILIKCNQKVLPFEQEPLEDIGEKNETYEEDFKEKMDEFIDKQPVEEEEKPVDLKLLEELTEEDKAFILENLNIVKFLKEARKISDRKSLIRNCFILENMYEVDPLIEEESLNNYIDNLMEDLCGFSFDIGAYDEFMKTKKTMSLFPSVKEMLKKLAKENESRPTTSPEQGKEAEKDKKLGAKPEKKDEKKEQERLEVERKEKEIAAAAKAAEDLKKSKIMAVNPLFYYEKQLNNTEVQTMGPGIILECLNDQLAYDKSTQSKENVFLQKENENDIREINKYVNLMDQKILNGFNDLVKFSIFLFFFLLKKPNNENFNINKQKNDANPFEMNDGDRKTPFKNIIDESDEIEIRTHNTHLNNLDDISLREKSLLNKMSFPGVNRYLMPELPDKSEQIRKAERAQYYPFISCDVSEVFINKIKKKIDLPSNSLKKL